MIASAVLAMASTRLRNPKLRANPPARLSSGTARSSQPNASKRAVRMFSIGPRSSPTARRKPSSNGDVLIAHVPQVKPVLETLGRGAWLLFEQLAPDLERFLPAAELAIDRDGFNMGVIRRPLIRVLPLQFERAFVVAV